MALGSVDRREYRSAGRQPVFRRERIWHDGEKRINFIARLVRHRRLRMG